MPKATLLRRAAPWLAALTLTAGLAGIYGRYVVRPSELFVGDLVSFYQPMRHDTARCLASGRLPLWTPAIFAGTPQIADAQLAVFYPPTLLHLALPFPLAELVALLLHLALGGLGMLWLARRLDLGWAPALLAGLGYAGSGFFVTHLVHPNFVHSAAWVPMLLALVHGLVAAPPGTGPRPRWAAGAAVITALTLLAGGLQVAYYGLGIATVMGLAWGLAHPGLRRRERLGRLVAVAGALALGGVLAAIQLLPTSEFAALSIRADGVTLELARSYRMAARQSLHLVVPFPFGLAERTPVLWSQPFHESFGYFGVAAVPLALTALAMPCARPFHWRGALPRWLLGGLALVALLAAMGPEAPVDLHRWLFRWLPGFDRFRAPGRLLFVTLTAAVILAAHGLGDLLEGDVARRARARTLHLAFTLLALGVALSVWLLASGATGPLPQATAALAQRSALGAALVAFAAWVLSAGGERLRVAPAWIGAGLVAVHLVDLLTVGRALVGARQVPPGTDVARRAHRPPPEVQADPRRASHPRRVLYRPDSYYMLQNAGLLHGYDNLRSYSPVMLRRTYDLLHLADRGRFAPWRRLPVDHNLIAVRHTGSPVLRLLGVGLMLGHDRPRAAPGQRADLHWRVTRIRDPLPRTFVAHTTRLAARRADRERLLASMDPGRIALVEDARALVGAAAPGPERAPTPATITARDRCLGDARIAVDTPAPGMLVFTEGWHPGWRARRDGRPVPVHRVDHGLLGVRLPAPGRHEVVLEFRPRSLSRGAGLSGIAGLGVLVLLGWPWGAAWWRRRGRRRAPVPGGNSEAPKAS